MTRDWFLLALLASSVSAQTATPHATGRVEGVVLNSVTGAPLARATVLLRRPVMASTPPTRVVFVEAFNQLVPEGAPISLATGADGKFVLDNVPEGSYWVHSSRTGFFGGTHSAADGLPAMIRVTASGSAGNVAIKMIPYATISGRVKDEEGEPLPNIQVVAAGAMYQNGRRLLTQTGQAQTNDLGEYRISNLLPGKYYLASAPTTRALQGALARTREAFPMTYFPEATSVAGATQFNVEPGSEIRDMDFRLKKQASVVVSGTVAGVPAGTSVSVLIAPSGEGVNRIDRTLQRFAPVKEGRFSIYGVTPGSYELRIDLDGPGNPEPLFARLPIDVGGEDLKDLRLTLAPGGQVTVKIRMEDGEWPQGFTPEVSLLPVDSIYRLRGDGILRDLEILLPNIPPGKYAPVFRFPSNAFAKSIRINQHEFGEQPIDVTANGHIQMDVVLSRRAGALSGTVEGPDGKPLAGATISAHAIDRSKFRGDLDKTVRSRADGTYVVSGLAPGSYRVFAWESRGGEWGWDEFRKGYESRSAIVTLSESGKQTLSLKVIPPPK